MPGRRIHPDLKSAPKILSRKDLTMHHPFRPESWWPLLRTAAMEWFKHNTSQLGAALAFYTIFSIAPILVIALGLIGWICGPDAFQSRLDEQIHEYVGQPVAEAI